MAERLRVALLTREFPPHVYGGAGVHVGYLARALASHVELAVHRFAGPDEPASPDGVYTSWQALAGGGAHRSALRTMSVDLAMAAGVEGSQLVHSHTWYANLAGHLAKLLYAIPHVCTTHSLEPLRPWKAEQLGGGYALSSFCERTALESADAVVAVSAAMRRDVLRCYPAVDPERVTVIHNGIDTDEYRPDPAVDVLVREGVDPRRPSVVFVGRITRQKGIHHLLDAAALIDPATQLVLCAGAPDTPALGDEVRHRVRELQARREGVIWIERLLARREAVQILSHATVFVCPSIYEPFGLVNLEAMACGAPVVATAVGGVPEVVVDGVTGLLVPFEAAAQGMPRDPAGFATDLADRVNALVAEPATARRYGAAGRRRAVEHFSWSAVAARTAALFERLAAASPPTRQTRRGT